MVSRAPRDWDNGAGKYGCSGQLRKGRHLSQLSGVHWRVWLHWGQLPYVRDGEIARTVVWHTIFGKHCECIAQKWTHLERLPPLASHLVLLSHCVLTQHGGQKQMSWISVRLRESNKGRLGLQSMCRRTVLFVQLNPVGRTVSFKNADLFKLQITTFAEKKKIQLTAKITNHLFTCYLNCMYKSNPVCWIQQWSFLLASYAQCLYFLVWAYEN